MVSFLPQISIALLKISRMRPILSHMRQRWVLFQFDPIQEAEPKVGGTWVLIEGGCSLRKGALSQDYGTVSYCTSPPFPIGDLNLCSVR